MEGNIFGKGREIIAFRPFDKLRANGLLVPSHSGSSEIEIASSRLRPMTRYDDVRGASDHAQRRFVSGTACRAATESRIYYPDCGRGAAKAENPLPRSLSHSGEREVESLDIEVFDVLGVGLDESLARRYLVAHQQGEGGVGAGSVRHFHGQQGAGGGVHGSAP